MMEKAIVIFGATGDLTYRKLMPALFGLFQTHQVDIPIIAVGRRPYHDAMYQEQVYLSYIKNNALPPRSQWEAFVERISYVQMDLQQPEQFLHLEQYLQTHVGTRQWLFYLALSPDLFESVCMGFSHCKLCAQQHIVLIEKPFGQSKAHVARINDALESTFGKQNIYRIDHYLGKEMIQTITALRFSNPFFETLWNNEGIERVEIIAFETLGVETRGDYYDHHGAMKDFVQNHLFQLLTLLFMEEPATLKDIKAEQSSVLSHLQQPTNLLLGQYEGYTQEPHVNPNSRTETFVCMDVRLDLPHLNQIPIRLLSGKAMRDKLTMIEVVFKSKQNGLYQNASAPRLQIQIFPDEGVNFQFNVKEINMDKLHPVALTYCQSCDLTYHAQSLEAYERLLLDALQEKDTLFTAYSFVAQSWEYMDLCRQSMETSPLVIYPRASRLEDIFELGKQLEKDDKN
ncbi:MAG: glucose-6-phosphate dehydrogenase [Erysipelotrichaceae bacterium]